jgi:uncharacterized membrane protein
VLLEKLDQLRTTKRRLVKTVIYRITAMVIAQIMSWMLFQRFEVNLGVAIVDIIQAFWYYIYEGFWSNRHTS